MPLPFPEINASLNTLSAILLVGGLVSIKQGKRERHKYFMVSAFCSSTVFLISYIAYHIMSGVHRYPGEGFMKTLYLTILLTHTVLAIVVVPLILRTFFLAWKEDFVRHKAIAKWTFPIWLYVSVTGVVVYGMLYHS